jgi:hypothetical protein
VGKAMHPARSRSSKLAIDSLAWGWRLRWWQTAKEIGNWCRPAAKIPKVERNADGGLFATLVGGLRMVSSGP